MANSPSFTELQQNSNEDMLELNKDLERMIEDVENMSVQQTLMAYDMVVLRTSPEVVGAMRRLEDAYLNCRVAFCRERDQEPEMDKCLEPMEKTEMSTEQIDSTDSIDLENILKGLDSLSNCMDQLALRTQLRQCDLIVCIGHPDKLVFLQRAQEGAKRSCARPKYEE